MSPNIWTWIAAILTLCIFSFLFRDNPFYRFAEHLFVGVSLGYSITNIWYLVITARIIDPIRGGNYIFIIPTIIGLLYFLRFVPKLSWLVRFPIAVSLGFSSGVAIPAIIQADVVKQIQGTLVLPGLFPNWQEYLGAAIVLIGVICTLIYFYFSREHTGVMKSISRIGIVFIMVGFGASFGYTVMARFSLLIGRFQFLLREWLGVVQ